MLILAVGLTAGISACGSSGTSVQAQSCSSIQECLSVGHRGGAPSVEVLNSPAVKFHNGWFTPAEPSHQLAWGYRLEFYDSGRGQWVEELADSLTTAPGCPNVPTVDVPTTTPAGRSVCYLAGGGADVACYYADGIFYQVSIALPTKITQAAREAFLLDEVDSLS